MPKSHDTLVWAMQTLGRSQGQSVDMQRLVLALRHVPENQDKLTWLRQVLEHAAGPTPVRVATPLVAELPLLQHDPVLGWTVLVARKPGGHWQAASPEGMKVIPAHRSGQLTVLLNWAPADAVGQGFRDKLEAGLRAARSDVLEAGLGSAFIQLLALVTSMFSMQVYDRVIPGKGMSTLLVLTSGVLLTIGLELVMKLARGRLMEHVVTRLDSRLSQDIFERLLSIRLDQLPASLGSLASQLRAYESVRSHYAASTFFAFIDMPMGLFLLMAMALIGHPVVVVVPMLLGAVSVAAGMLVRHRMEAQAQAGARDAHRKLGLLVETVEGMETLKAASGGAWQQSRWLALGRETLRNELAGRSTTEMSAHAMASLQQLGDVSVVATGAWAVMNGHMTTGALVACSILAGRVLSPLLAWPGLLLQKAHAQAALEGLDRLYRLQTDQMAGPALLPARLRGDFQIREAQFAYHDHPCALHIPSLHIRAGERLALIGPIGSGKSTLLKVLAGLYRPQQGKVLIDGLDMSHIHRQVVCRHVGYLQQNHRLLQGTLRENLLLGIPDLGDEAMLDAIRRTGFDRVVAAHPLGLERPISEGGQGLSGGQKQLLAFTRLVLCAPDIWLLDEPTAAMDEAQAQQCLDILAQEVRAGKTMVLVTHNVLVPLVASKPNRISLAQWEKLTLQELAGKSEKTEAKTADVPGAGDSPLQCELVLANVRSHSLQWVRQQLDSVEQCTRELQLLEAWLDQQPGAQSVRLSRLAQELGTFDRVYRQMLSMVDAPADEPAGHVQVLPKADLMAPSTPLGTFDLQPSAAGPEPDTDGSDRAQVYERLGQLADYLARVEPHSPTPYLVRRAVQWGQMSLPEVMDEFIREDGDLKRFRSFILSQPRADKPGT